MLGRVSSVVRREAAIKGLFKYAGNSKTSVVRAAVSERAALHSRAKERQHSQSTSSGLLKRLWKGLAAAGLAFAATTVNVASTAEEEEPKFPHVVGVVQYQSNAPIEDRFSIKKTDVGFFISVFDGHGGWQAAEFAQGCLVDNIVSSVPNGGKQDFKQAMIAGFEKTEAQFISKLRPAFQVGFGDLNHVGCCALSVLLANNTVFVANAGDCQAVLAHRKWGRLQAVPLSRIHNANMKEEQDRLRREHPNEVDIVRCKSSQACYVKGRLMPTRAIGDAYLKYPEFNNTVVWDKTRGRAVGAPYTPPYITATPEVVERAIQPGDDFVIIASDGLWDELTPEEAVQIASQEKEPELASQRLLESALKKAADRHHISVEQLKLIAPGRRRSLHDDITVAVVSLQPFRS
eukprot:GILJ01002479.1.p1 GENE.GILJ01002479.1~~GILJ01002479.1.p1  ORF type:complete len:421 (-),score=51.54 GILJ01002479.1:235-1446(-)